MLWLLSLLISTAHAALPPTAEMNVYRFYGLTDLAHAHATSYKQVQGSFAPYFTGFISMRDADTCETSLLGHLQAYSLLVMEEHKYLTEEQKAAQANLIKLFSPEQVTFLEMTRPIPNSDLHLYTQEDIAAQPPTAEPNTSHVKEGSLWVIAGQGRIANNRETFHLGEDTHAMSALPWKTDMRVTTYQEFDPYIIQVGIQPMPLEISRGQMYSREKYPLVWELGRAAQKKPEYVMALLKAALVVIEEDISTLQADPSQAFVFAKALDPLRRKRFEQMGFRPVEGDCDLNGICNMVAPFLELTKKYAPGSHSYRVKRVSELLKVAAGDPTTFNILRRAQAHFRADLDFIVPEKKVFADGPIVLHDFSKHYQISLRIMGELAGLSIPESLAMVREVSQYRYDFTPPNTPGKMYPIAPFQADFEKMNVISLSNLTSEFAHDELLPILLISTDNYILNRYKEMHILDPEQILTQIPPVYAIQTDDLKLIAALEKFSILFGGDKYPVKNGIHTFLFPREKIKLLRQVYAAYTSMTDHPLAQGYWFFRAISASSMKF